MKKHINIHIIRLIFIFVSFFIPHLAFASNYEITFPLFIDAKIIPYNQIEQRGQTIVGNQSVGWNSYYASGYIEQDHEGTQVFHIPGLDSDGGIINTLSVSYICVSPKKNGKSISQVMYVNPLNLGTFLLNNAPGWFPSGRNLFPGSIGIDIGDMKIISQYFQKGYHSLSFTCSQSKDIFEGLPKVQTGDMLTYRIQYPVGTNVAAKLFRVQPLKHITILSNYASDSGSGFLQVPWQIDPCGSISSPCTSEGIIGTSLSGKTTDLRILWESYRKISEYYPIPADTATISFQIGEKKN